MVAGLHRERDFGQLILSSLQSGARGRTEIGRRIFVRADGGSAAAPEILSTANLFLSAMLGLAGHGSGAGGRAESRCLADDPRYSRGRSGTHGSRVGKLARDRRRSAPGDRHRRYRASLAHGILLRILSRSAICAPLAIVKATIFLPRIRCIPGRQSMRRLEHYFLETFLEC
jgi:hypothetical protein